MDENDYAPEASVWFKQAERDLKAARASYDDKEFELSAQQARNAAEKALKAAWILVSGDAPEEKHSVTELSRMVAMDDLVQEVQERPLLGGMSEQEATAYRLIEIADRIMAEIRPKFPAAAKPAMKY